MKSLKIIVPRAFYYKVYSVYYISYLKQHIEHNRGLLGREREIREREEEPAETRRGRSAAMGGLQRRGQAKRADHGVVD